MVSISHELYPHLFDIIVDAAPYLSLLALRAASSTLRDRVDKLLVRHIAVHVPSVDEWGEGVEDYADHLWSVNGNKWYARIPRSDWLQKDTLADAVRIVDIHTHRDMPPSHTEPMVRPDPGATYRPRIRPTRRGGHHRPRSPHTRYGLEEPRDTNNAIPWLPPGGIKNLAKGSCTWCYSREKWDKCDILRDLADLLCHVQLVRRWGMHFCTAHIKSQRAVVFHAPLPSAIGKRATTGVMASPVHVVHVRHEGMWNPHLQYLRGQEWTRTLSPTNEQDFESEGEREHYERAARRHASRVGERVAWENLRDSAPFRQESGLFPTRVVYRMSQDHPNPYESNIRFDSEDDSIAFLGHTTQDLYQSLMIHIYLRRRKCTMVDVENWRLLRYHTGFHPGFATHRDFMVEVVTSEVAPLVASFNDRYHPTKSDYDAAQEIVEKYLEFVTEDEYRASVGEEIYALEAYPNSG